MERIAELFDLCCCCVRALPVQSLAREEEIARRRPIRFNVTFEIVQIFHESKNKYLFSTFLYSSACLIKIIKMQDNK